MAKVFLAEPNDRYSLDAAALFGTVQYVVAEGLRPFKTPQAMRSLITGLERAGYDPEEDFLCMTGHALAVTLLVAAATQRFPKVKLLLFDAASSEYKERVLENSVLINGSL